MPTFITQYSEHNNFSPTTSFAVSPIPHPQFLSTSNVPNFGHHPHLLGAQSQAILGPFQIILGWAITTVPSKFRFPPFSQQQFFYVPQFHDTHTTIPSVPPESFKFLFHRGPKISNFSRTICTRGGPDLLNTTHEAPNVKILGSPRDSHKRLGGFSPQHFPTISHRGPNPQNMFLPNKKCFAHFPRGGTKIFFPPKFCRDKTRFSNNGFFDKPELIFHPLGHFFPTKLFPKGPYSHFHGRAQPTYCPTPAP